MIDQENALTGLEIAIVGMAGRFPKAKNIDEFWENLKAGVEAISFFTDEELLADGDNPQMVKNPNYIKARGIVEAADKFDAQFFNFFPKEAEMLDPQHRFFLECAWEALENAGYNPDRYPGLIGVFGGVSMNTYIMSFLNSRRGLVSSAEGYQLTIGNDKDFLSTKVSYKMNLKGPSLSVQTACSTSLTAIYLACQSLLNFQCDMALAGGTSISIPQKRGYYYQEGMILSPDGHCRAFDAKAGGTVSGNGTAIVLLKRLEDAQVDRDHIYAVIKGSACNNDGAQRVGYTAPGVDGQAQVISLAQAAANVDPDTIGYIETHGTGTTLGDPIEVSALTQVFREQTARKQFCAIGSVKTNIGHLDAAAGAAGLIKAALSLHHQVIPPSLHYENPNPKIDFKNSPFFVNTQLRDWKPGESARRAGVSSFGIGGTNVHVVLEEAPAPLVSGDSRPYQMLAISAKSATALEKQTENLLEYFKTHPETDFSDAVYTALVGRKHFNHRRFFICENRDDAVKVLETNDPARILTTSFPPDLGESPVIFMFSGQGAQYVNMGKDLYAGEPGFRENIDRCAELLINQLGLDLRELLFPPADKQDEATEKLNQTEYTQPALFVIEYALAQLWQEWGIKPQAMLGHSIGEYVAACLAGVFSLEDALTLVVKRGQLMQTMPPGAMLSVNLDEAALKPFLNENLALAGVNAQALCVVAGPFEAIDALEKALEVKGIQCRRLHTSHAFHSQMMEPILAPFTEVVKQIKLNAPQVPYLSNVSGTWISVEDATDPNYWAQHLRQGVRFADGIRELLENPARIFLEVGPGKTLSTLARRAPGQTTGRIFLSSLPHPQETGSDGAFILNTLGRLWQSGVEIHWQNFYRHESRNRVPLPTYPFERQRYWLETGNGSLPTAAPIEVDKKQPFSDWFYIPGWKRISLSELKTTKPAEFKEIFLADENDFCEKLLQQLKSRNAEVVTVKKGTEFAQNDSNVIFLNPQATGDFEILVKQLNLNAPARIIYSWTAASAEMLSDLVHLTRALDAQHVTVPLQIVVVTSEVLDVTGTEEINPLRATALGALKVIPQEYPNIRCKLVDFADALSQAKVLENFTEELLHFEPPVVAYRGPHRWVQQFEPLDVSEKRPAKLKNAGVYLITGGLGRIGLAFSDYLARTYRARLALVDPMPFPERDTWNEWLENHDPKDRISQKIHALEALEGAGGTVRIFRADSAEKPEMQQVLEQIRAEFGKIDGVIHAAGLVGEGAMKSLQELTAADIAEQFKAKVQGAEVLGELFRDASLDFVMLQSSLASILGGLGMAAYTAANIYLDSFAARQARISKIPWISVNWDGWNFDLARIQETAIGSNLAEFTITPEEGVAVLEKVLGFNQLPQVVVSTGHLQTRLNQWIERQPESAGKSPSQTGAWHPRPNLPNPFVAPDSPLENEIVEMWRELLGIGEIGIHDSFFELGGHSLIATQLVSRLRETFKVELPLRDLFESPTVAFLAGNIEKSRLANQQVSAELSDMLKMVAGLSDEDAKNLLTQKKTQ
jgi:acyl transferase domain-containing protein